MGAYDMEGRWGASMLNMGVAILHSWKGMTNSFQRNDRYKNFARTGSLNTTTVKTNTYWMFFRLQNVYINYYIMLIK